MQNLFLTLYLKAQVIRHALKEENGQDLVEYALVIAVVCLGIISGMNTLAMIRNPTSLPRALIIGR